MARTSAETARQAPRLAVYIPVFVTGSDAEGGDFFEFAAIVNLSAGGALLATRRFIPEDVELKFEIPQFPLGEIAEKMGSLRQFSGRTVRRSTCEDHHLLGVAFTAPLTVRGLTVSAGGKSGLSV